MMTWAVLLVTLWLPFPVRTPGAIRDDLTLAQICTTKWGLDHRSVKVDAKRTVAAWYGVKWAARGQFEFDHLVPRSLGGADVAENLWPMCCIRAGKITGQAHQKDLLEVRLGRLVCKGEVSLVEAQQAFMRDWVQALQKWPAPAPKPKATPRPRTHTQAR